MHWMLVMFKFHTAKQAIKRTQVQMELAVFFAVFVCFIRRNFGRFSEVGGASDS